MSSNQLRVYVNDSSEVALGAAGYKPSEVWVRCVDNDHHCHFDRTLEDMQTWLFTLINRYVRSELPTYWASFRGRPSDLVYTFYMEKMTPKCRYGGHRCYFDGDYEKWKAEPIPYCTLIDRYAQTGKVSFEAYVLSAVRHRLGDGPRGGVKGYYKDGSVISLDSLAPRMGDGMLVSMGLSCDESQGVFDNMSLDESVFRGLVYDLWIDESMLSRLQSQLRQLRSIEPVQYRKYLERYLTMRGSIKRKDCKEFFDLLFDVPLSYRASQKEKLLSSVIK